MPTIFNETDSVFFVGGRGTKAGDALAGGCSKAYWDASGSLADIMGANGEPVADAADCTLSESAAGKVLITKAAAFGDVEAGHVAYINFVGIYDDGRYRVTENQLTANTFEVDIAWSAPTTCTVKVGGAFDKLETALDNTDADDTTPHNVTIFTNKAETITAAIDFPSGGAKLSDTHLIVEGFNTQPGDMNYGGTYYQGPLDAYINGINADKCIDIDADGNSIDILEITTKYNILLRNLYLHNTAGNNNNGIELVSTPRGLQFVNCKFDAVYAFFSGTAYGIEAIDCFFKTARYSQGTNFSWYASYFYRCVFDGTGRTGCMYSNYVTLIDCLFANGLYAITADRTVGLINCVCYNQTYTCVRLMGSYAELWGYNNILVPAAISDFAVFIHSDGGSISPEFSHNCVYSIGNGALTNQVYNQKTGEYYDLPGVVIEQDPQFREAPNGDFRPRNPNVLRGGKRDIADNATQMGAVLQRYQFARRAKAANLGRLQIVR